MALSEPHRLATRDKTRADGDGTHPVGVEALDARGPILIERAVVEVGMRVDQAHFSTSRNACGKSSTTSDGT
ncbi:MAG: hypothetical protein NTV92_05050, partial [Candidatus Bipolaricaulota bacterium]|nr:hypothetical protein [Candidatus Bipolaricaulota bacterium]